MGSQRVIHDRATFMGRAQFKDFSVAQMVKNPPAMKETRVRSLGWEVSLESEVSQSCPTLCNPMDCSLSGSSVHGIFQARILEWVARSDKGPIQRIQE